MAADSNKDSLHYRRSLVIAPKTTTQFNQFLPTKDKQAAYVPAPLRKKRAERHEDSRRSWASPMYTEEDGTFSRTLTSVRPGPIPTNNGCISQNSLQWAYKCESGSGDESDPERPVPDLVLDGLASRRFHSPSPTRQLHPTHQPCGAREFSRVRRSFRGERRDMPNGHSEHEHPTAAD